MTLKHVLLVGAIAALAACAGVESAGRNANRVSAPVPVTTQSAPAPAPAPLTQPPPAMTQPPAASQVQVPLDPAPPASEDDDDDIVVRGVQERQVPAPAGDPRPTAERMRDIRAWDTCVMRIQSAGEVNPTRPQLESPEEVCARSLGMADRLAVPTNRRED